MSSLTNFGMLWGSRGDTPAMPVGSSIQFFMCMCLLSCLCVAPDVACGTMGAVARVDPTATIVTPRTRLENSPSFRTDLSLFVTLVLFIVVSWRTASGRP